MVISATLALLAVAGLAGLAGGSPPLRRVDDRVVGRRRMDRRDGRRPAPIRPRWLRRGDRAARSPRGRTGSLHRGVGPVRGGRCPAGHQMGRGTGGRWTLATARGEHRRRRRRADRPVRACSHRVPLARRCRVGRSAWRERRRRPRGGRRVGPGGRRDTGHRRAADRYGRADRAPSAWGPGARRRAARDAARPSRRGMAPPARRPPARSKPQAVDEGEIDEAGAALVAALDAHGVGHPPGRAGPSGRR